MAHLICKKCGKIYRSKEEKIDDLGTCECGGDLKYIQNFNMHFDEELDPINELTICPNCGKEILSTEKLCKSCQDKQKAEKSEK